MKTILVYQTRHGSTKRVAEKIAKRIGNTQIVNLDDNPSPDLTAYDQVILGKPMYAGLSNSAMKTFGIAHKAELLQKRLGLFVLGLQPEGSKQREEEFRLAFPSDLQHHAMQYAFLGGELRKKSLSMAEKLIISKLLTTENDIHAIDTAALEDFIKTMKT